MEAMSEPTDGGGGGDGGQGFVSEGTAKNIETGSQGVGWGSAALDAVSGTTSWLAGTNALHESQELMSAAQSWDPAVTAASAAAKTGQLSFADELASQAGAAFKGEGSALNILNNGAEAAEAGEGALGGLGKALPFIGTGASVLSAGMNAFQMANDVKRDGGFANAYHDQEFYNHAGGTALGAAHAILPYIPVYGEAANLALTAGEVGANLGGQAAGWAFGKDAGFSADSIVGGGIRGMFGDQSMGEQARQGVTGLLGNGVLGNTLGTAADLAVNLNPAGMMANLGMTAGKGIAHEGEAIFNSIATGQGAVGGFLHDLPGNAMNLGGKAVNGLENLGQGALNLGGKAVSGLESAGSTALNAVTHNPVSNAIGGAVSAVSHW